MAKKIRKASTSIHKRQRSSEESTPYSRPYSFYSLEDIKAASEEELKEKLAAFDTYINKRLASPLDTYLKRQVAFTRLRRATVYGMLEEWQAALSDLDQIIAEQTGAGEVNTAHVLRAEIRQKLQHYDLAIADYTHVLAVIDQTPPGEVEHLSRLRIEVRLGRAKLYALTQRYEEALADFNQVLLLDPSNDDAYSSRGLACAYAGRMEQALADCNRALELGQSSYSFHRRGVARTLNKDFHHAIEDLNQALALDPGNDQIEEDLRRTRLLLLLGSLLGVVEEDLPSS
jgi:tetratricopeptide (TPR) repeat protein